MLCHRLAEYVTSMRFEDIPHEVVAKTKAVVLHEIAVSLGGVGADSPVGPLISARPLAFGGRAPFRGGLCRA